jgi:asparagine synthetase B (glutamine-hydrolysing)
MWLEIDQSTFAVRQSGFHAQSFGDRVLYLSPGLDNLSSIDQLADSEYGQAIEVDIKNRVVSFGRDYLGHHPLLYAEYSTSLFISDEFTDIHNWLNHQGVRLTISEEAIALYFAAGYVPQGYTIFEQIKACENVSIYRWVNGKISQISLFKPVEGDERFSLAELGERIEHEVEVLANTSRAIDVWCSGGLDSSILATRFNSQGRKANLLTMHYDDEVVKAHGDGEVRFAKEVASACRTSLHYATLTKVLYRSVFDKFCRMHIGPVIDFVVPPKYALAQASRDLAVTGEGGDPLFGGVKNNTVMFSHRRFPSMKLGEIYAHAHDRFMAHLPDILVRGEQLKEFVADYYERQLAKYPGDLIRKLFYLNSLGKQGGMIFPKNYYAGKRYGVTVRHPLTALPVYQAAFLLPDRKKYLYPTGKLALIQLYESQLPGVVVKRKKSGTRLFLDYYLNYLAPRGLELDALRSSGLFHEDCLSKWNVYPESNANLIFGYALHTLNQWLKHNGGNHHVQPESCETDNYQQRCVSV